MSALPPVKGCGFESESGGFKEILIGERKFSATVVRRALHSFPSIPKEHPPVSHLTITPIETITYRVQDGESTHLFTSEQDAEAFCLKRQAQQLIAKGFGGETIREEVWEFLLDFRKELEPLLTKMVETF